MRPWLPRGASRCLAAAKGKSQYAHRASFHLEFIARRMRRWRVEEPSFFPRIDQPLPPNILLTRQDKFHRVMQGIEEKHEGGVLHRMAAFVSHIGRVSDENHAEAVDKR